MARSMAKTTTSTSTAPAAPSANWLQLKKNIESTPGKKRKAPAIAPDGALANGSAKRRKTEPETRVSPAPSNGVHAILAQRKDRVVGIDATVELPESKNGESIAALRAMISGEVDYSESQRQPGRYLALDCEMVGVGIDGAESSLARVSLVNFHGAVQMDVFVRQRERVVDYRTQFSGVRPADMVHAKPFEEVQMEVAKLLRGKILIGHAVHNDTKAMLLSHPRPDTRDTQYLAWKHKVVKTNRAALRNLARQELGIIIQSGEHSSVTDARTTMAIFRLHRKEWEKGHRPLDADKKKRDKVSASSKEAAEADEDEDQEEQHSGGGRKGVSSGLSVVVKHRRGGGGGNAHDKRSVSKSGKAGWWKQLG